MTSEHITLGLIGYPLEHSFSPIIHQAALNTLGLSGKYRLFPIPPKTGVRENFRDIINRLRNKDIHGLNVTIPYKQLIVEFCDQESHAVSTIGAANTLISHNGKIIADNTDVQGFWTDLKPLLDKERCTNGDALILGTGGAARAVCYALLTHNWKVTIAARNTSKGEILAHSFNSFYRQITIIPFENKAIKTNLHQVNLLVNATPVGMHPQSNLSPILLDKQFPKNLIVYDLIYNPFQTPLLKHAIHSGCTWKNGLGMLIEQAALSLERWLGMSVPREALLNAVKEFQK